MFSPVDTGWNENCGASNCFDGYTGPETYCRRSGMCHIGDYHTNPYLRLDIGYSRWVWGLQIYNRALHSWELGEHEVWVGMSPAGPMGAGNLQCYRHTTSTSGVPLLDKLCTASTATWGK